MKVSVDEATGYLVLDELTEGVEILPTALYQSYLTQISDLQKKVADLHEKLANIAVDQAKANVISEENRKRHLENMEIMAQTERGIGVAIGLFCRNNGNAKQGAYYYKIFEEMWRYLEEENPAFLDSMEHKYAHLNQINNLQIPMLEEKI